MPRKDSSLRSTAVRSTGAHRQRAEQVPLSSFFDNDSARGNNIHTRDNQSTSDVSRLTSSSHHSDNRLWTNSLPPTILSTKYSVEHTSLLQDVRQRILKESEEEREARSLSRRQNRHSKLNLHRQRALQIAFGMDASVGAAPGGVRRSAVRTDNVDTSSGYTNDQDELIVSSVEFSLVCPYSRLPMRCPVRSCDCRHLQCCELESWIVLMGKYRSLRDPKAPCPVCEQRVSASSLEVDFWMQNVVEQMPPDTHLVVLNIDGSYRSGDESREKRKESMITDVIDATQGDLDGHLSEVIDDGSDDDWNKDNCGKVEFKFDSVSGIGVKRDRTASQSTCTSPLVYVTANAAVLSQGPQATTTVANSVVKTEVTMVSLGIASTTTTGQAAGISQASSSDDNGVVVVRYVQGRTLPSQVRLWVSYCMHCGNELSNCQSVHTEVCSHCGYCVKEHRTLVRRFPENPAVTMELTPDDTLILCGVDAIAAYLYRAGFQRYLEPQELFVITEASFPAAFPTPQRPTRSVWTSGAPLTRFELDFLEACCERVANGEGLEEVRGMMVPKLFRIPRLRRSALEFLTQQARLEHKVIFSMQTQPSLTP
ncbi:unnamed protein product [Phytomonas sp. EM1]|nr:unnamed protein product [Phytomonas sp. EM1]|eukprot:CCW60333.1 unnamed protein product [Phytomonas sp. isolate EM1]